MLFPAKVTNEHAQESSLKEGVINGEVDSCRGPKRKSGTDMDRTQESGA